MPSPSARPLLLLLPVALALSCSTQRQPTIGKSRSSDEAASTSSTTSARETNEPYRPYRRPPPRELLPATKKQDLEQRGTCWQADESHFRHEEQRGISAIDAQARRDGGNLLAAQFHSVLAPGVPREVGSEFRGAKGERFMLVGEANTGGTPPLFVINGDKEVYSVYGSAKGEKTVVIPSCSPIGCGGGGMATPRAPIVVEVPEGATFIGAKEVSASLETAVRFAVSEPCMPRP